MKEKTYLGHDGKFITEEEYSEFVRTEIVVNAVTHRDYGIKGTDIQIKMFDDRLEVDSPGIFAGGVKKENIRYTHFSRNPKIAAFLKDYDYVKEYGEGVDRMCRELEAIGLPDPAFNNDTFILKTTVLSASYKKLPVESSITADSSQNLPIGHKKPADLDAFKGKESADLPDKLPIAFYIDAYKGKGYSRPTIDSLMIIYDSIAVNQIFGSAYLTKILDVSERTGRSLMSRLREMDVIVAVSGQGKGKYRFKYDSEI